MTTAALEPLRTAELWLLHWLNHEPTIARYQETSR